MQNLSSKESLWRKFVIIIRPMRLNSNNGEKKKINERHNTKNSWSSSLRKVENFRISIAYRGVSHYSHYINFIKNDQWPSNSRHSSVFCSTNRQSQSYKFQKLINPIPIQNCLFYFHNNGMHQTKRFFLFIKHWWIYPQW